MQTDSIAGWVAEADSIPEPAAFSVSKSMGGFDGQSPMEAVSILCRGNEGTQLDYRVHTPDTEDVEDIRGDVRTTEHPFGEEDHFGYVARVHEQVRGQERELPKICVCDDQVLPDIRGASIGAQVQVSSSRKGKTSSLALDRGDGEGLELENESSGSVDRNERSSRRHAEVRSATIEYPGREGCVEREGDNGIREGEDEKHSRASRVRACVERLSSVDGPAGQLAATASIPVDVRLGTESGREEAGDSIERAQAEKELSDQAQRGACGAGCDKPDRGALVRRDDPEVHPDGRSGDERRDTQIDRPDARSIPVASTSNSINNHCDEPDIWIELPSYSRPLDRFRVFDSFRGEQR